MPDRVRHPGFTSAVSGLFQGKDYFYCGSVFAAAGGRPVRPGAGVNASGKGFGGINGCLIRF